MNNLQVLKEEIARISSREVAEMMEVKRHSDLLEKIDKINEVFLKNGKIRCSDYWIESTYRQDGNGKENREYLITKIGCEFIAHKSTGEKGIIFTHKYMQRFEELEKTLQINQLSACDIEKIITNKVTEQINRLSNTYSNYVRPLSVDKYRISRYIKDRLEIQKANEEYELVKERILIMLDAEKWEDVPVEVLSKSMDLIDESIKIIKSERKDNQISFF
ncbi:DNA-binding protein [Clostridioides difficile]|uniref:Rha family transcriptional regulator n=2 Tax=Clostridioides difficile TaxID=1496 RepID=UPI001033A30B|nr:Rha family transcriptional regulator [Clostridioides difficile]MCI4869135.1 Rha family transcriptional regulator [Clostridioides difficile]MDB2713631.1 DNA-binding protein [Clostridioides difficile]MDI3039451.1 Rha family transcriptional regulator [Clostridioides difficile]VHX65781.1 anti-repressor [Clostridioides difficile]VHY45866.1 anti-repressor [Clostridioides difficile]